MGIRRQPDPIFLTSLMSLSKIDVLGRFEQGWSLAFSRSSWKSLYHLPVLKIVKSPNETLKILGVFQRSVPVLTKLKAKSFFHSFQKQNIADPTEQF